MSDRIKPHIEAARRALKEAVERRPKGRTVKPVQLRDDPAIPKYDDIYERESK